MKFIITESQSNLLKKFIVSRFKKGETPDFISSIGVSMDDVVDAIMDLEIPSKSEPIQICLDFYTELINTLLKTSKLLNRFKYDDGTEIYLEYNSFYGSISYDYAGEGSVRMHGYATLFYDGMCGLTVDMVEYTFGKSWESTHMNKFIDLKKQSKKIRTYGDLIKFCNKDYFNLIKNVLDGFIDELKKEL